ncbi:MAG: GHMP kinase [Methylobacter sp.]|nr:GHMP kinase [Methylobacter sp.]
MFIVTRSYPRAALVGNPSDGYFGKTIAFVFRNFRAEVALWESDELEILPDSRDMLVYASIDKMAEDIQVHGYYGGVRLIKAAIKCFFDYCKVESIAIDKKNFTLRYDTTIPQRLGLAGSSAIITACMRALMLFYEVTIPKPQLANLILSAELKELKIGAGLQDRVAQVYQGLVYMDFDAAMMEHQGSGSYESLEIGLLPNLYIAYRTDLAEGSEDTHNDLRERYNRGDKKVLKVMEGLAELAKQVKTLLQAGRGSEICRLLDRNFDLRRSILNISDGNLQMVEVARSAGASANFTGSGGAIIGTYTDDEMYACLKTALSAIGVKVIKPEITPSVD